MATSSITHNFVIEGAAVERLADAIEASWNQEIPERPPVGHELKDPGELEEFWTKLQER